MPLRREDCTPCQLRKWGGLHAGLPAPWLRMLASTPTLHGCTCFPAPSARLPSRLPHRPCHAQTQDQLVAAKAVEEEKRNAALASDEPGNVVGGSMRL